MKIIFCISNLSVPAVISIVAECNDDFLIITDQDSLNMFFSELYEPNKVKLVKGLILKNNLKKLLQFIYWQNHKKRIWKLFKHYNNAKIFFFYNGYGFFISWLIKKLSRENEVFYAPDLKIESLKKKYDLISILKILQIYIIFGVLTKPLYAGKNRMLAVTTWFLKKINANIIEIRIEKNLIKNYVSNKFKIPNSSILYLTGGLIELKIIEKNEFIEKTDNLIMQIENKSVFLKAHPRLNYLHSKESRLPLIPYYVPANILFFLFNYVIGYSTSVLFEAANNDCVSISLLDYYNPIYEKRRLIYKTLLKENLLENKEILFPSNIIEFLQIIENKL